MSRLSAEQVKLGMQKSGITITQWAEQRGYPRELVYRVLNGQLKARFGRSHEIAVALGMKVEASQPDESKYRDVAVFGPSWLVCA